MNEVYLLNVSLLTKCQTCLLLLNVALRKQMFQMFVSLIDIVATEVKHQLSHQLTVKLERSTYRMSLSLSLTPHPLLLYSDRLINSYLQCERL